MQNSFIVSPMKQTIELKASETYKGSITVANPADAKNDISFTVELTPYSVSGSDYKADFKTMSDWSRMVEWTTLETTSGTLKPNEKKEIKFSVKVPENAPAGGQYAMIGVAMEPSTAGTVANVVEMASLIYANVEGETVHQGRIVENSVPGFVSTGTPKTTVKLENTGNVHETATTTITAKNVFSGEEMVFDVTADNAYETLVMPDTTRDVVRELIGLPQLGIFEVKQTVNYLGDTSDISTTMIICPIWFIALILGLIASIIGMICYGAHLKRKKSLKIS